MKKRKENVSRLRKKITNGKYLSIKIPVATEEREVEPVVVTSTGEGVAATNN